MQTQHSAQKSKRAESVNVQDFRSKTSPGVLTRIRQCSCTMDNTEPPPPSRCHLPPLQIDWQHINVIGPLDYVVALTDTKVEGFHIQGNRARIGSNISSDCFVTQCPTYQYFRRRQGTEEFHPAFHAFDNRLVPTDAQNKNAIIVITQPCRATWHNMAQQEGKLVVLGWFAREQKDSGFFWVMDWVSDEHVDPLTGRAAF